MVNEECAFLTLRCWQHRQKAGSVLSVFFACTLYSICFVCTVRKGLYIAYVQYVRATKHIYLGYIRVIIISCFALMNPNERGGGVVPSIFGYNYRLRCNTE